MLAAFQDNRVIVDNKRFGRGNIVID